MTRATARNHINMKLNAVTKGLHSDDSWIPVYAAWKVIEDLGFDLNIVSSEYGHNDGVPCEKVWKFEIDLGTKKPLYGILTAHGAGTVDDPLCKYDISAYVS